ncbi:MAG: hypothetical protein KBC15_02595 [Candidatus Levybacteria bacterium]|nr:hypothetical protein [Candidatus Levybacteria bacterium]
MLEKLNEKIDVITIYRRVGAQVKIHKIRWNGRDYKITHHSYHHKIREGRHVFHIFHVGTDALSFRLKHDPDILSWTLEEVSDGLTN